MDAGGQFHGPADLPHGKEPPVPTGQEAGWAPMNPNVRIKLSALTQL